MIVLQLIRLHPFKENSIAFLTCLTLTLTYYTSILVSLTY